MADTELVEELLTEARNIRNSSGVGSPEVSSRAVAIGWFKSAACLVQSYYMPGMFNPACVTFAVLHKHQLCLRCSESA